jgi:hypothetical protein
MPCHTRPHSRLWRKGTRACRMGGVFPSRGHGGRNRWICWMLHHLSNHILDTIKDKASDASWHSNRNTKCCLAFGLPILLHQQQEVGAPHSCRGIRTDLWIGCFAEQRKECTTSRLTGHRVGHRGRTTGLLVFHRGRTTGLSRATTTYVGEWGEIRGLQPFFSGIFCR